MRLPRNMGYTEKIYNCIDDLLMQDNTFSRENLKSKVQHTHQEFYKGLTTQIKQTGKVNKSHQKEAKEHQQLSFLRQKQSSLENPSITTNMMNSQQNRLKKQTNSIIPKPRNIHKTVLLQEDKDNNYLNVKNEQNLRGLIDNSQTFSSNNGELKMRKTFSYELESKESDLIKMQDDCQVEGNERQDETRSNENSPKALLTFPAINTKMMQQPSQTSFSKRDSLRKHNRLNQALPNRINQRRQQNILFYHKTQQKKKPQEDSNKPAQFCLTHEELQFLSLLYPNQSPNQLMLKLLSYYEEQKQYKNSFQQLLQKQTPKSNHMFRTSHKIQLKIPDSIIQLQEKDHFHGDHEDDDDYGEDSMFVKYTQAQSKMNHRESDYSRLKEECLAALGQQMVQTQIKSSLAETAHVNYYTRQYAMPIIMQTIKQKNQQALQKLLKLQQIRKAQKYEFAHKAQQIKAILNQAQTTHGPLFPQISYSKLPEDFIHKVYIPVNSRGQSFDMDQKSDLKLFDYMAESQYRRILRDINHLIQKVLSYHRHSSFIKRKNNSLFRGWNLALFIFLFIVLLMLYIRSFLLHGSTDLDTIVFFCLSFISILLLGNSFNNYKKSVTRSSVIKDICAEISSYLDFINSSNKNIKWVLGKDFFWLEVWINVLKLNNK